MTPEQQTSLNDALDAVTLARANAERKASAYQSVDAIINPKAATVL